MKRGVYAGVIVLLLVISLVSASPTKVGIASDIHPSIILDKIKEQPAPFFFHVGKLHFNNGNYDKALDMFEKALEFNPDMAIALHNIGVIHYENGNYASARDAFADALGIDASYAKAFYSLGVLFFETGNFYEASVAFKEVVKLEQDNADAYFDVAQSLVAKFRSEGEEDYKDLREAENYLKEAIDLDASIPHAENNLEIIENILVDRRILLD